MPSGYWEPHTGSPDWCERNYAWTVWVAEFWNTLSSLPLVFVGARGIYLAMHYNYGVPFIVGNFVLLFVGVGSTAFHGTLSYEGQCLDELAMIYCALAFMVSGWRYCPPGGHSHCCDLLCLPSSPFYRPHE